MSENDLENSSSSQNFNYSYQTMSNMLLQQTLKRIYIQTLQTKNLVNGIFNNINNPKLYRQQKNKHLCKKQSYWMNQQNSKDQAHSMCQEQYPDWDKWAYCSLKPQIRDLKINISSKKHIQQLKQHLENRNDQKERQQECQKNKQLIRSLLMVLQNFFKDYEHKQQLKQGKIRYSKTFQAIKASKIQFQYIIKKIEDQIKKSKGDTRLSEKCELLFKQLIYYIKIQVSRNHEKQSIQQEQMNKLQQQIEQLKQSIKKSADQEQKQKEQKKKLSIFQQKKKLYISQKYMEKFSGQLKEWLKIIKQTPSFNFDPLLTKKQKHVIRLYLSRMYQMIFSDTLQKYMQGKLSSQNFKIYSSKNIIFNIHSFFRELVRLYSDQKQENAKQTKYSEKLKFNKLNVILDFINKQSQQCVKQITNKYPQSNSSEGSYILQKKIRVFDHLQSDRFDLLFTNKDQKNLPKIQFGKPLVNKSDQQHGIEQNYDQKRDRGYVSQIMQSINYVTQLCHKPIQEQDASYTCQNAFQDIMISIFNRADQIKKEEVIQIETNNLKKLQKEQSLKSRLQKIFKIKQIYKAHNKQVDYKINLKSPKKEQFGEDQINNEQFILKGKSTLRILTKWVQQLSQKLKNTYQNFSNRQQKIKTRDGKLVSLAKDIYQQGIEQIVSQSRIKNIRIKQKLIQLKRHFTLIETEIFNIFEKGKHINTVDTNISIISTHTQMCIGNYMMIYLNDLIEKLVELSENNDNRKIDFVTFKISDLMRAKCNGRANQIIKIYQCLEHVSNLYPQILQIVRIKNRLNTNNNDVLINLMFNQKILCEVQLSIEKNIESSISENAKLNDFNHYLYQLGRSLFGVIAESCSIISKKDSLSKSFSFEQSNENGKLSYINRGKQLINQITKTKGEFLLPYICNQCKFLKNNNSVSDLNEKKNNFCDQCFQKKLKNQKNQKQFIDKCLYNQPNSDYYKLVFPQSCKDIPQRGILIVKYNKQKLYHKYEKINYPENSPNHIIIKNNTEEDAQILFKFSQKEQNRSILNKYYFLEKEQKQNLDQENFEAKYKRRQKVKRKVNLDYLEQSYKKDNYIIKSQQQYKHQKKLLSRFQSVNAKITSLHMERIEQKEIIIPKQIDKLQQFSFINNLSETLIIQLQQQLKRVEISKNKNLSSLYLNEAINCKQLTLKQNQKLKLFNFFEGYRKSKVQKLTIQQNEKIEQLLLPLCPQLKQIYVIGNIKLTNMNFDNLPKINKIVIRKNEQLSTVKLSKKNSLRQLIIRQNKQLISITLQEANQIQIITLRQNSKLKKFISPRQNKIQRLFLDQLGKYQFTLQNFGNLAYLKQLFLRSINIKGILKICHSYKLQRITINNINIQELIIQQQYPKLNLLNLESCKKLTVVKIPNIKNLTLKLLYNNKLCYKKCFGQKENFSVEELLINSLKEHNSLEFKNLANLKKLTVENSQITQIKDLKMNYLQYLKLFSNRNLTKIQLSIPYWKSDQNLNSQKKQHSKLRQLNISYNQKLEIPGVLNFEDFPILQSLDCSAITFKQFDKSNLKLNKNTIIKKITSEKNCLKEVSIENCERLSQLYLNNSSIQKLHLIASRQLKIFQSNIQPQEIHIQLSNQRDMQRSPFWLTIIRMLGSIYKKLIEFQLAKECVVYAQISCQWGKQINKQFLQWQISLKQRNNQQKQKQNIQKLKIKLDKIAKLKYSFEQGDQYQKIYQEKKKNIQDQSKKIVQRIDQEKKKNIKDQGKKAKNNQIRKLNAVQRYSMQEKGVIQANSMEFILEQFRMQYIMENEPSNLNTNKLKSNLVLNQKLITKNNMEVVKFQ